MATKSTTEAIPNLVGKTGKEIAVMVLSGALTRDQAEEFIVQRALRKFRAQLEAVGA